MRIHELKLKTEFFDAVLSGEKPFEIRSNDRGFQNGDGVLFLELEIDGRHHTFSRKAAADITYVLSGWGLENGYVVFGIKNVKEVQE